MASDKAKEWLDKVITGTDPKSATEQIFNCTNNDSLTTKVGQLKRQFSDEIHTYLTNDMRYAAPSAFNMIKVIANNTNVKDVPAAVRLKACQDILSRAGFDPAQVHEIKTPLTKEQLQGKLLSIVEDNPDAVTNLLAMVENNQEIKH